MSGARPVLSAGVLRFEANTGGAGSPSSIRALVRGFWFRRIVLSRSIAARLAVGYLMTPVLLFLTVYLHSPFSIAGAALIAAGLVLAGRTRTSRSPGRAVALPVWAIVTFGAVATLVAASTGASGGFRLMGDWFKHNSMLFELSSGPWPVVFQDLSDASLVYSFAVYLPPAALAHVAGGSITLAHLALVAWMALGFFAVLLTVATLLPSRWRVVGAIAVLLTYAGAESLGAWIVSAHTSTTPSGFWIGQIVQYSSSWTQIRWVPQHALSGWIVGALYVMAWRGRSWTSVRALVFASLGAALWSPFVFLAGAFLAAAAAVRLIVATRRAPTVPVLLATVLAGVGSTPVVLFLTLPAGEQHLTTGTMSPSEYLLFIGLMLGLWVLGAAVTSRLRWALLPPVVLVVALPLFRLGEWNDLVMRTSIPALFVLTFAAWDGALRSRRGTTRYRVGVVALGAAVVLGAPSGLTELSYAVTWAEEVPGTIPEPVDIRQPLPVYLVESNSGPRTPIWNQYVTCVDGTAGRLLGLPRCTA